MLVKEPVFFRQITIFEGFRLVSTPGNQPPDQGCTVKKCINQNGFPLEEEG